VIALGVAIVQFRVGLVHSHVSAAYIEGRDHPFHDSIVNFYLVFGLRRVAPCRAVEIRVSFKLFMLCSIDSDVAACWPPKCSYAPDSDYHFLDQRGSRRDILLSFPWGCFAFF
jgi:hypothetical protein